MAENLSDRIDNFAIYLPAVQHMSARKLASNGVLRKSGPRSEITTLDLNWYEPSNKHWSYKWCLSSAANMAFNDTDNIITDRHQDTILLGDSGGYQIGTGALPQLKKWQIKSGTYEELDELWTNSDVRSGILGWLDANCNMAMTIDMPLWVMYGKNASSPFHKLTEQQLTNMTLKNLEFFDTYRDRTTGARFLNVIQAYGVNEELAFASEDRWYDAVKDFKFEGWALGSDVRAVSGIYGFIRRLLIMKDDGKLDDPRNWVHILGTSRKVWAVCFTAMQRALRKYTNPNLTISFDSASPYLTAGKVPRYCVHRELTADWATWSMATDILPTGYGVSNSQNKTQFPGRSPVASLFTLRDLNVRGDPFAVKTTDNLADEVLLNHNVYSYITAIIEANELVFNRPQNAPPDMVKAVRVIDELFAAKDWKGKLLENREFLITLSEREKDTALPADSEE